MKPRELMKDADLQRIWDAAYAAEFCADLRRTKEISEAIGAQSMYHGADWGEFLEKASPGAARYAVDVATAAVGALINLDIEVNDGEI